MTVSVRTVWVAVCLVGCQGGSPTQTPTDQPTVIHSPVAAVPSQAAQELSFPDFEAHTAAGVDSMLSALRVLRPAAEAVDIPGIAAGAQLLTDATGAELDWLREVESAGAISETTCFFDAAAAYSRGVFEFSLAASEATHFAETGDAHYAGTVAERMTSGGDEFEQFERLRQDAAVRC